MTSSFEWGRAHNIHGPWDTTSAYESGQSDAERPAATVDGASDPQEAPASDPSVALNSDGSEVSAARGSEDAMEPPAPSSGHGGSTTRAVDEGDTRG